HEDAALLRNHDEHPIGVVDQDGTRVCLRLHAKYSLAGDRVYERELAVVVSSVLTTVPHIQLLAACVVIDEVRPLREILCSGYRESPSIERLAGAVGATGHEKLLNVRGIEDALWLAEAGDTAHPLARSEIDHFHGVVLEGGDKQPMAFEVNGEMVQASGDFRQRDRLREPQRLGTLRDGGKAAGQSSCKQPRKPQHVLACPGSR